MGQEAHHVDFFADVNHGHTHKKSEEITAAINDILKRGRLVADFALERTFSAGHESIGKLATGHIFIIETPDSAPSPGAALSEEDRRPVLETNPL